MSISVKICGITNGDDAEAAIDAGCSAIGLNFVPTSARYIDFQQAEIIIERIESRVPVIGVFVNPAVQDVDAVIRVGLDYCQFHGNETAEFCDKFDHPYIKTAGVGANFSFDEFVAQYSNASGWLLDVEDGQLFGGTGRVFDWAQWPKNDERNLILAGGLTVENVRQAIEVTGTKSVDVASGVEVDGDKRSKDVTKMKLFIMEAQSAS